MQIGPSPSAPLLEISRFCDHVLVNADENCFDFTWAEPRDISLVHVVFEPSFVSIGNPALITGVYYWKYNWPEKRPQPKEGSGQSGWAAQDDWYKGSWKAADIESNRHPGVPLMISFSFKPLASKDYPVTFRRGLKLRIQFNKKVVHVAKVKDIKVFTNTLCAPSTFSVAADLEWYDTTNTFTASIWNGYFMVHGNHVDDMKVGGAFDSPISILACICNEPWSYDGTAVTVWIPGHKTFTFSINDLAARGYILIPDLHVLVRNGSNAMSWNEAISDLLVRQVAAAAKHDNNTIDHPALQGKSVHRRVFELPEQTLDAALAAFKDKQLMHYVLGCEGVRSKGVLSISGNVHAANRFIKKVEGSDTRRVIWTKAMLKVSKLFTIDETPGGLDLTKKIKTRQLLDGFLPVMTTTWELIPGVSLQQEAYATLLRGTEVGQLPVGDDDVVVMEKLTITNSSEIEHDVVLSMVFGQSDGLNDASLPEPLFELASVIPAKAVQGHVVTLAARGEKVYRCMIIPGDKDIVVSAEQDVLPAIEIALKLAPATSRNICTKLPLLAIDEAAIDSHLASLDHDGEQLKVVAYWRNRLDRAASIEVPSVDFTGFYKNHLYHVLVSNDREIGSDLVFGRVGSLVYGTFANEVCMIVMDLDRRGMHDDARKILDVFIKYQGTKGLLGDYEDIDGIFFGANGYENGEGYNQNQGFVLWAMAEHARLSRDGDWFARNANAIVKACDWITRERDLFKESLAHRSRAPFRLPGELYHGLLPAGGVEDVLDFWYWLSTNAYNSFGMMQAACMLQMAGHPEASRIVADATDYVHAVKRAFDAGMALSPVVVLRDGTSVQHYPSSLPRRGRAFGWIQETLEGAIHLIRTWTVNPFTRAAASIMKDYEDNLYLSEEYGYPIIGERFENDWFNLGGFSQQPCLLCSSWPYGIRGNTKHFLRATLNAFAVNYRADTRTFCEHPLPGMLDVRGDFFKTSDEANFCGSLRDALVQETIASVDEVLEGWEGDPDNHPHSDAMDTLHALGSWDSMDALRVLYHVPRDWLDNGKEIHAKALPTYFGTCSIDMLSKTGDGRVDIKIALDRGNAQRLVPRLKAVFVKARHPDSSAKITYLVLEIVETSDAETTYQQLSPSFIRHQAFGMGLSARLTPGWKHVELRARVFFRDPRPEELKPSISVS